MTKSFSIPAMFLAALAFFTLPAAAASGNSAWQVQKTAMGYHNSGMAQPEGPLAGGSAQVAFDPKRPEGGTFQLSFQTTGLFTPREAMGVTDPDKLRKIAMPAQTPATFTARSLKRNGDSIFAEGTLTINGQSRPTGINMAVQETGSASKGRGLQLSGRFMINRPGFATDDIGYVGPANIPVNFDIYATMAPTAAAEEEQAAVPDAAQMEAGTTAPAQDNAVTPYGRRSAPPQQQGTAPTAAEPPAESEIGKVRTFGGAPVDSPAETQAAPAEPAPLGTVRTFGGAQ